MNFIAASKYAKRLLPTKYYPTVKRYYELLSFRRFFLSLPNGLFPTYQYPATLTIMLTTRCNLECFICRREGFRGEDLKFENIRKLKTAIRYARAINLTGWGEPLLYPRFEDVVQYIFSLNSKRDLIQITTNGTKLSNHTAKLLSGHLKTVTISLNAATPDTYHRDMKHGDFEKTISAIRLFLDGLGKRERRNVKLYFVAHSQNFREIPDFVVLAKNLGISCVAVGHYLISLAEHSQFSLLHVKEEYDAVIGQAKKVGKELDILVDVQRRFFIEKLRSFRGCLAPFNECLIDEKGEVWPCCFCGSYRMGNAYEAGFESIWFGEEYRRLRKKRYLPACRQCSVFTPLDEYSTHFTSRFKETSVFHEIARNCKIGFNTDLRSKE